VIAPDDPAFAHPLDMRAALADALVRRGHRPPDSDGGWVRLIYRSLALSFARSLRELENVTGEKVRSVRVIGGGAQSALLCQMIADASECPVVSGPVEATAWGNVLVQAAAINGGSVGAWRDRFRPVWAERTHCPRVSPELEAARAGH
jgi:rhamnulokinase